MFLIVRLIINMIAILIIAYLFPGLIWVEGFWAALTAAFLLGIVNAILRPILVFRMPAQAVLPFCSSNLRQNLRAGGSEAR